MVASTTGPNGLTTSFEYDAFGRKRKEIRADGSETFTFLEACGGDIICPAGAAFHTRVTDSSGAEGITYFNKLNQEIHKQSLLAGKWSIVDTEYDTQGRVVRKSEPYFDGDTVYWTQIEYDLIGRPILTTRPDGATQSVAYDGLTQVATNELGQTKTVHKDIMGRMKSVIDNAGHAIAYHYDALGQVTEMLAAGKSQSFHYNIRGNKVRDTDPDKGTWTYRYNALGLLVAQTDAKGQLTRMTYDVLGRMLTRIDDANTPNGISDRTSSWVYDTAPMGIGKVHTVTKGEYTITNSYDELGRPSSSTEEVDSKSFTTSTTYDALSRPETMTYPSDGMASGIVTRNVYDGQGALLRVESDADGSAYWERQEVDARGNITKARMGNGVETTKMYTPEIGRLSGIVSAHGGAT
ncbi:MAG: hypothetical protein AAF228_12710, partial [Pseudomonadota bacterium]